MFQDQLLPNLQGIMFAVGCLNRKRNFKGKLWALDKVSQRGESLNSALCERSVNVWL